ncbi:toprim domain-containing protein [Pseudomonas sp. UMAB-40]|uniref:toprim domain-containing protein n=1 Tax=Pseudomonas sp. UMAB-40 TaxID=1365407 RepID=UPI001C57F843|nr:toprim domain-containing protein [Pseudomonas sp. UMAB-40]
MADENAPNGRSPLQTAMQVARIYFQNHLKEDPVAKEYVQKRGLTPQSLYKFQIGYAPDQFKGLCDHFTFHRVRLAAEQASLLFTLPNSKRMGDFFQGRLMFPIKGMDGDILGYAGRLLVPKEGSGKYINTAETAIFKKGELLYGMYENSQAIKAADEAMLVEGYIDVITMAANEFPIGLAPMGTALTGNQFRLILNMGVKKLTVCLDGDAAGQRAADRTINVVMDQYHPSMQVCVALLPDGHDPDSMIREHGVEAFRAAKDCAIPLDEYIHQLCAKGHRTPPGLEDRAEYLQKLKDYLTRSSGVLYSKLYSHAEKYSGLPTKELNALLPNAEATNKINWDANTALAARWLVHDHHLQKRIAAQIAGIELKTMGLGELTDLAKQYLDGSEPSGKLYQFAKAHGALAPTEVAELRGNWKSWMTRASIEENLGRIAENPYNDAAKKAIRMTLN